MKILLVTRGSQGDIYPFLILAKELESHGHKVTLSLPQLFKEHAQKFDLNYVLQDEDDISGMITKTSESKQKAFQVLKWMRQVIDMQFRQLIPLLQEHDILISANTEFAAASIAEYCKKPVIRTAFGPFLPGKKIPPAVIPFPEPGKIFKPMFFWKMLNKGTNLMVRSTINKNRVALGMKPIENFGKHAAGYCMNYLFYSPELGSIDTDWKYKWDIGGYCFNDTLHYDKAAYEELMNFIYKDDRPTLFFTLGSCSDKNRNRFCEMLADICEQENYKLVVGSGWSKAGTHMNQNESFYLLTSAIPHNLILDKFTAAIHHGGCGTTHSVARAGIPQMIVPLFIDQNYWGYRVTTLGIGPKLANISKIKKEELQKRVVDLMSNPIYKKSAAVLGEKMKTENGPQAFCEFLERIYKIC